MQRKGYKSTCQKNAFTLIELLVVIAIIALLMAVVLPGLRKAKQAGQRIVCAAHQKGFGYAFLAYVEEYDGKSHWGPNQGLWYVPGTRDMYDADDSSAYWGVAYYPYAENMEVFHCPSARRVDDWWDESTQDQYQWCHFGLNGFAASRVTTRIKQPGQFIILQDHIEQKLDNNGDMFHIPPGQNVNLQMWRTSWRSDYPEAVAECFRHSRTAYGDTESTFPYDTPGTGVSNSLWLDGHVSPIKETTGENVPVRWYTGGEGDGAQEVWTSRDTPAY